MARRTATLNRERSPEGSMVACGAASSLSLHIQLSTTQRDVGRLLAKRIDQL